jgi:hypothetical protein
MMGLIALLGAWSSGARGDIVATFDDLPDLPARNAATSVPAANGGNSVYQGATWDSRFEVVGDQFSLNPAPNPPPNPDFGLPHSGHFFVTNGGSGDNGLMIETQNVLTGAWFGRNQYYGYGGGADQVTIVALHGSHELASVVFDLPLNHPGEPEPLSFVDTSTFLSLSGITGYRIDRHAPSQYATNWVADDFQFKPTPEPASIALFASALPALAAFVWGKRRRGQAALPVALTV